MEITKKMLENEIKVLQKAAKIHAKYSISQYKEVLNILYELEQEKALLEEKVKLRTSHLEKEITQKENLAKELEKVAKYDQLTGLANRYLFLNELELVKKEADLLDLPFSLFFLDLDGFKFVNDTYGHDIGDLLLKEVANRLKKSVRKNDLVARLGGDEFVLILKNIDDKDILSKIANNIIKKIKKVYFINDLELYVGTSIGIYVYDSLEDNINDIVSKADIAMYEAKRNGKGRFIFFDKSMKDELSKITNYKNRIKNALKNNEFINYFQPIVLSTDYKIKGVEVLLRWKNKDKIISPNEFIPILEEDISLIKEITFWQIEEVIKLLSKTKVFFSINLSAKLLNDDDLIDKMKYFLKKYKFNSKQIYFEVTETTLLLNIQKASFFLQKLKHLGFKLSMDDFGTGYSSLTYIKDLPFDTIKVDKKFVFNILKSNKDKKLLKAIINMAKILSLDVVLEGIELNNQLDFIEKENYIKFQGYLFYKPMDLKGLLKINFG